MRILLLLQELHSKLEILSRQTDHLARHYLSHLAGLQCQCDETEEEVTFGTLHFSVAYLKEKSTVEVAVLEGKNLPPLDSDGCHSCVVYALKFVGVHINPKIKQTIKCKCLHQCRAQCG